MYKTNLDSTKRFKNYTQQFCQTCSCYTSFFFGGGGGGEGGESAEAKADREKSKKNIEISHKITKMSSLSMGEISLTTLKTCFIIIIT